MQIIFYENRYGDWTDKVIRWKTASWKQRFNGSWKDLPSHVELLFSNNEMFSASQYENKVRYKQCNTKAKCWTGIHIECDEHKVKEWCDKHVGKKYDYMGVLGFVLPFIHDNKNKWFCSEICCEALKQNTDLIPKVVISSKTSPAKLKEIIGMLKCQK